MLPKVITIFVSDIIWILYLCTSGLHNRKMPNQKLQLTFFSSRNAAVNDLEKRCAKRSSDEAADLWKHAWQRYKIESSQFIKPPKCFQKSDPTSPTKVQAWRIRYRALTIKHFLPFFRARLEFSTGQATKRYEKVIDLLESWKAISPEHIWKEPAIPENIIKLPRPEPLSIVSLPRPPFTSSCNISSEVLPSKDPARTQSETCMGMCGDSDFSSEDEVLEFFSELA